MRQPPGMVTEAPTSPKSLLARKPFVQLTFAQMALTVKVAPLQLDGATTEPSQPVLLGWVGSLVMIVPSIQALNRVPPPSARFGEGQFAKAEQLARPPPRLSVQLCEMTS
ncbi:MAG: hypothetical protein EA370_04080 [Wenzhouxiangella sp.]|nr:MAG: hypothetical protein EA370_04080 [Wenzhouxiangella sp.]